MTSKPSAFLIYGGVGLTAFGVAYDGGLLGPTDGHDHSAVFSASVSATGTNTGATYAVMNFVTGDEIVAMLPRQTPPKHQT